MKKIVVTLSYVLLFPLCTVAQETTATRQDHIVHINQIQIIGTHNSYHTGLAPSEAKVVEQASPKGMQALDYAHQPLPDQLSGGVRQLEIDVYADSKGGRYSHPTIVDKVAAAGLPADPDFDPNHEMDKPGFKVMHGMNIDQRSYCHTFVGCLTIVRSWSQQHPGHLPIFILVETKQGGRARTASPAGAQPAPLGPEAFTSATFDALDAEIRSVFSGKEMITPDQIRGNYNTLPEAVQATGKSVKGKKGGWPTLAEARNKVVFLMDQKPVTLVYTEGHPALRGRIIFTNAEPGSPDAAFIEQNDPDKVRIDTLSLQGYIIRTRTDDSTVEARANDHTHANAALSSGAQMLSTDYPPTEPAKWNGFFVGLPNGLVARCNPVTAPPGCVDSMIEPSVAKQ